MRFDFLGFLTAAENVKQPVEAASLAARESVSRENISSLKAVERFDCTAERATI